MSRAADAGAAGVTVGLQGGAWKDWRGGGVREAVRQQAMGVRPAMRQGIADGEAGRRVMISEA